MSCCDVFLICTLQVRDAETAWEMVFALALFRMRKLEMPQECTLVKMETFTSSGAWISCHEMSQHVTISYNIIIV